MESWSFKLKCGRLKSPKNVYARRKLKKLVKLYNFATKIYENMLPKYKKIIISTLILIQVAYFGDPKNTIKKIMGNNFFP